MKPIKFIHFSFVAFLLLISSCAKPGDHSTQRVIMPDKPGLVLDGKASWYGVPFHGRRTANGEIYDMNQISAAHKSLPFGAWLKVTNLNNQKKLLVRINDRGPYVDGRIIDLSFAAAKQLDMIQHGVARVKVEVYLPTQNNLLLAQNPLVLQTNTKPPLYAKKSRE